NHAQKILQRKNISCQTADAAPAILLSPYPSTMDQSAPHQHIDPAWRIGMVVGFATTVVMWLIAFFLHLQGLTADPAVTGVALLAAQFGGSALAGRFTAPDRSHWKLGLC